MRRLFTIPSSLPVHVTLSSTGLHILGDLETHLRLAIYDLFNSASEDPGFNGINVPALGRRFFFTRYPRASLISFGGLHQSPLCPGGTPVIHPKVHPH